MSHPKKIGKIGVLAGGPSNEREISLRSGKAVYDALTKQGFDVVFLDVWDNVRDAVRGGGIELAFIALHGKFGEDGTVQKILEEAGIPYTGSGVKASALALDKIASKNIFEDRGIPTPKSLVFTQNDFNAVKAAGLGFPLVVKPQFEGSSIGLSVVRSKDEVGKALDRAFVYGEKVMLEEYIEGRELTVGILDDEPLPVIEIVTKNKVYDYAAKYQDPDTRYLVPAPIENRFSERAKELGRRAHVALGCKSFSRVDMMLDSAGNIFVLEVNTIPGMTERSLLPKAAQVKGLNFNQLCVKIVESALNNKESVKI